LLLRGTLTSLPPFSRSVSGGCLPPSCFTVPFSPWFVKTKSPKGTLLSLWGRRFNRDLQRASQEEQGHRAGAGVGADHRADEVDLHLFDPQLLLNLLGHVLGVLQTVPVA